MLRINLEFRAIGLFPMIFLLLNSILYSSHTPLPFVRILFLYTLQQLLSVGRLCCTEASNWLRLQLLHLSTAIRSANVLPLCFQSLNPVLLFPCTRQAAVLGVLTRMSSVSINHGCSSTTNLSFLNSSKIYLIPGIPSPKNSCIIREPLNK